MRRLRLFTFAIPLLSAVACNDATAPSRTSGVQIPGARHSLVIPSTTPQVSAGGDHTCALKSDGTVVCWGSSSEAPYGQAIVPDGIGPVAQVSAAGYFTCALKIDGTVSCWGYNGDGQTTVPNGLASVAQISAGAGGNFVCALKTDGTLICWGYNNEGETNVPGGLASVAQVSSAIYHACALKTDGTVVCWGDMNSYGQAIVPSGLASVAQISAGGWHTCALKTDGTVVCWGDNTYGEMNIPAGLASVAQISAGEFHTCALKKDKTVVCWGSNEFGQISVPGDLTSVTQVSAGDHQTCVLKTDGTVVCWGDTVVPNGSAAVPVGLNLNGTQDITPPVTTINLAVDGSGLALSSGQATLSTVIAFTFSGTDAVGVVAFRCSLDAVPFVACSSPVTYSGLAVGSHTFQVTAFDAAGNVSLPANFAWAVESTAQATNNLITTVSSIGLPSGVASSLSAPLSNLNTNNLVSACGKLNAFINQVGAKAQNGQLTTSASSQLLQAASAIKASLGCG